VEPISLSSCRSMFDVFSLEIAGKSPYSGRANDVIVVLARGLCRWWCHGSVYILQ